jgi:hypothetical protein
LNRLIRSPLFSFLIQPQLFVAPLRKLLPLTLKTFPRSHRAIQNARGDREP